MKDLVIGDVHFGIKTNNISWLEQQIEFFNKKVIPLIPEHDRVVVLGDLFDIRYSVNTQIGIEVKKLVRLLNSYNKPIWFVAGNHDFYSPVMDTEQYNAYSLVFGTEFQQMNQNIHFVVKTPIWDNDTLFMPWYYTENRERYMHCINSYMISSIKRTTLIYCHSDLSAWDQEMIISKGEATVISGHIHYPWINKDDKLYNIGSACSFNFNDVNQDKYIYTIENGVITKTYENDITPKFRRWYNEAIFTLTENDFTNAYVQLCINKDNINKAKYIERLKEVKEYPAISIKVNIVDTDYEDLLKGNSCFNTNIEDYIRHNIPEHLINKYEKINNKLNNPEE